MGGHGTAEQRVYHDVATLACLVILLILIAAAAHVTSGPRPTRNRVSIEAKILSGGFLRKWGFSIVLSLEASSTFVAIRVVRVRWTSDPANVMISIEKDTLLLLLFAHRLQTIIVDEDS